MVQGIVSKVLTRDWNGKKFFSVGLVNDAIYGFGMANPRVNEGDKVSFEAVKNDRGYWEADKNTLKVIPRGDQEVVANESAAVVSKGSAKSDYALKEEYWRAKEKRDVENDHLRSLGAARNTAIEWVKFLVEKEAIPLGKIASKREEALVQVLNDYTVKFMSGITPVLDTDKVESLTIDDKEGLTITKRVGRPKKEANVAVEAVAEDEAAWN